jgi:hypothetical protein
MTVLPGARKRKLRDTGNAYCLEPGLNNYHNRVNNG